MAEKFRHLTKWEMTSPYDNDHEIEEQEVRTLRWELDIDPESYYTLDELRELKKEQDELDKEDLRDDQR